MVGNDGLNWLDVLGLKSTEYNTKDEAGKAGALAAKAKTEEDRNNHTDALGKGRDDGIGAREWAGKICQDCKSKKFYYSDPKPGTPESKLPPGVNGTSNPDDSPCEKGDDEVGEYHSHPSSNGASGPDKERADKTKLDSYIGKGDPNQPPTAEKYEPDPDYDSRKPWNNSPDYQNGGTINGGNGKRTQL
jgi:hypothetical protein